MINLLVLLTIVGMALASETGLKDKHKCICRNGTPKAAFCKYAYEEACVSCNAGFQIDSMFGCVAPCTCPNGVAKGICDSLSGVLCSRCNMGYKLVKYKCQSCACKSDYKPVCTPFGITYDNDCLARCHGASSWRAGACKSALHFKPKSRAGLKAVVDACLRVSAVGDCSKIAHGPIGEWDVSLVTDMSRIFEHPGPFNGDVSKWDMSSVTNTYSMFWRAKSFNGDISKWDVSRVTDMTYMFFGAKSFNGDISKWDVSRVTGMHHMFSEAESFNGDISKWDVSRVVQMTYTFESAKSFNIDLSKWDVSRVTRMQGMFQDASSFAQTLCGAAWIKSTANKERMFDGSKGRIESKCPVTGTTTTVTTTTVTTTTTTTTFVRNATAIDSSSGLGFVSLAVVVAIIAHL